MAYAFNEDRSKINVYTEDEIDAMHIVDKETIDAKNAQQDQAIADETAARILADSTESGARSAADTLINARIDTLVDHGTGGIEVRELLWQQAGGVNSGTINLPADFDAANYDCLECECGVAYPSWKIVGYQRIPVTGGTLHSAESDGSNDAMFTALALSVSGTVVTCGNAGNASSGDGGSTWGVASASVMVSKIYGIKYAQDCSAEVADIRVGYDGTTYASAGNAVRGQVEDLHEKIEHYEVSSRKIALSNTVGYFINWSSRGPLSNNQFSVSAPFFVHAGETVHVYAQGYLNAVAILSYVTPGYDVTTAQGNSACCVIRSEDSNPGWFTYRAPIGGYMVVTTNKDTIPSVFISPVDSYSENETPLDISIDRQNYISVTLEEISSTGCFISSKIQLEAGDVVHIEADQLNFYVNVALFVKLDNDDNFEFPISVYYRNANTDITNAWIKIPNSGYYVLSYGFGEMALKNITVIKNAANEALEHELMLLNAHEANLTLDLTKKGKYMSWNGYLVNQANWCITEPFALKKGWAYVKVGAYTNMCAVIAKVNDDNTYTSLMRTTRVVGQDDTFLWYKVQIPEDGYYVTNYRFQVKYTAGQVPVCVYVEDEEINPLEFTNLQMGYASIFDAIGCIGDSLTIGSSNYNSPISSEYTNPKNRWPRQLEMMLGNTCHAFANGGNTTRLWLQRWGSNTEFLNNPCEAYIISLGVNDYYYYSISNPNGVPLGTSADVGTDADTFYGNYAKIISKIKTVQPRAKIFVVTNPKCPDAGLGYNEAIRYMATYYSDVFLLDLYEYGHDIYATLFTSGTGYWNGAHGTAPGYHLAAKHISSMIDYVIENNPTNFDDVQFIGTDYYYN